MLNFGHLRYFWAVAHEGNLTRAAAALHVSQSAVSVQIHKLEAELGQPLFQRRGRRLELTGPGRLALDHADAIFGLGDRLAAAVRKGAAARQALRVGALATLSRNFQLAFLAPALERPDVAVTVRSGVVRSLLRQLESHRLDVLLSNMAPSRDGGTPWVPHVIGEQAVALVGHPARVRAVRDWRKLLGREPLVLPSPESSIRGAFDALVYQLGIVPQVAAEVDDMAMLRLLVRQNAGLGVVPPIVVRDELAAGTLRQVARLPGIKETFFAITLPREFPHPLLAELIPAARETLASRLRTDARPARRERRARGPSR
jgi:LysR family transcriptional activator of nhaA